MQGAGHDAARYDGPASGTRPSGHTLPLILNFVSVVLATLLILAAFLGQELARSGLLMLFAGAGALAGSLLLINRRLAAKTRCSILERSGIPAGALAAASVVILTLATGHGDERIVPLALACWLIVAFIGAALSLLEHLLRPPVAAAIIASLAAAATLAPLWLGPLSELSRSASIVNGVLAASPLTFLAVAAEFDYLRTSWFYQNSVLGALRYQYPPVWALIVAYSVPPILSLGSEIVRGRFPRASDLTDNDRPSRSQ